MPYNPDGSFSLVFSFGTGTAVDNLFPQQVGDTFNDIASNLNTGTLVTNLSTVFAVKATTLAGYGITDAEQLGMVAGINTQTVTNYTVVLTDIGKVVEMNNAGVNTIVIPPHSTVAFATRSQFTFAQIGAGQTTIAPGAGVLVRSIGSARRLSAQYATAVLYQRAQDEWVASGQLVV